MTDEPLKKKKRHVKTEQQRIKEANDRWLAKKEDKRKGPPKMWASLGKRKPFDYEELL